MWFLLLPTLGGLPPPSYALEEHGDPGLWGGKHLSGLWSLTPGHCWLPCGQVLPALCPSPPAAGMPGSLQVQALGQGRAGQSRHWRWGLGTGAVSAPVFPHQCCSFRPVPHLPHPCQSSAPPAASAGPTPTTPGQDGSLCCFGFFSVLAPRTHMFVHVCACAYVRACLCTSCVHVCTRESVCLCLWVACGCLGLCLGPHLYPGPGARTLECAGRAGAAPWGRLGGAGGGAWAAPWGVRGLGLYLQGRRES